MRTSLALLAAGLAASAASAQTVVPAQAPPVRVQVPVQVVPAPATVQPARPAAAPAQVIPAPAVAPAPAQAAPAAEAPATPLTDRPEDEKAIRMLLRSFVTAYNAGQTSAMEPLLVENAVVVDSEGTSTRGRANVLAQYEDGFAGGAPDPVDGKMEALHFFGKDAAQFEGSFAIDRGAEEAPTTGVFIGTLVRDGDAWKIAELRDKLDEIPAADSNYDYLSGLEWMIGDWVDESENVKIETQIRWAENRNFIVRRYTLHIGGEKALSGTQWIGYDPQRQQIRSWVFDSEGGFGEGTWTQQGDQWIVKATGVLREGQPSSATQIITPLNKDSAQLSSMDRIVGGVVMPDIEEVVMVRKAPEPADAPAPAPAATTETPAANP